MPNTLEDKDWNLLLQKIKDGKCTPFLGAGVCVEKIPVCSIADEWAKNYGYPMKDSDDLARVAQYVAVTEEDETFPRNKICNIIKELLKEITPKDFEIPDEIHGVLADLPLPVYIITTYDDLMVQALESHDNHDKTPKEEICRWKESPKKSKRTLSGFDPTSEKPLVYYLYGCYKEPESLVLTEEDYLDFLVAISREQKLLLPRIQQTFKETSLLLLGYKVTDWDFRVLCRILDEYLRRSKRKHISVQLVPGDVSEAQVEKAQKYLDKYFEGLDIHVYWQGCRKFAMELRTRWEAFSRGTILEPVPDKIKEEVVSILFLSADPIKAPLLRLGEEFREINEELKKSKLREHFRLELPGLSARPRDISQALFDTKPQIVHFSGHGTPTGELCFEGLQGKTHPVESDALAALFEHFRGQVDCVILNACYSEIQAKAISKYIKYVIGMNQAIGDEAAIAFSTGFYQALFGGSSIEEAYKLGCVQIQLQNIPEHLKPVLIKEGSVVVVTAQQNKD